MKNILKKAHEITREMKVKYPEISYSAQLGLSISYLVAEEKYNKQKKVYTNYGTFSRKQIGVIFAATKRGDIVVRSKFISEMYNYYTDLSGYQAQDNYNRNGIVCDSIDDAITAIFANDYLEAQKQIDRAQEF